MPIKYISQPRQKLNAAFKNAAPNAKPTATVATNSAPARSAIKPVAANRNPTNCANCGGSTASKADGFEIQDIFFRTHPAT